MKNSTIRAIEENKIIAILRGIPEDKLIDLAEALYRGGVRLVEVTFNAEGRISDEETASRIRTLTQHFKGRMLVGAGTVLTKKQVHLANEAGALFIISPDTFTDVIEESSALGLVSIPGALTPSEVTAANRAGADFIKLFPVTELGAGYVKAISAPLSHIRFLAVGGITEENIGEYLRSGVCGFGIGSNIADKKLIAQNDFDAEKRAARYVEAVKNV